jgi:hypothetical protein
LLLVVVCVSHSAICQENSAGGANRSKHPLPEYVQEFFLSDAVRCQEKGEWQLTGGVDSRQRIGTSGLLKTQYGLTNRLQLGVELPYGLTEEETDEPQSRWSTASLGVEYQILRSNQPFALSAGIAIGVPVRSHGEVEYEPTLVIAKGFRKLQIHASFVADIEEEKPSFQYNVASVYSVRRHWFPTFEFNGRSLHGDAAFYLTPGMYRHLPHHLEIGAGVPLGVGGVAGRLGIVGKATLELGSIHERESPPSLKSRPKDRVAQPCRDAHGQKSGIC